ncbi:MAG: hypothetical protein ABFR90_05105 [Planctomycetota bacterium]
MKMKIIFLVMGILACVFDFILIFMTTELSGGGPGAPLEGVVIMFLCGIPILLFSLTSIVGSSICLSKSKKDKMLSFSGLSFGIIGLILFGLIFIAESSL